MMWLWAKSPETVIRNAGEIAKHVSYKALLDMLSGVVQRNVEDKIAAKAAAKEHRAAIRGLEKKCMRRRARVERQIKIKLDFADCMGKPILDLFEPGEKCLLNPNQVWTIPGKMPFVFTKVRSLLTTCVYVWTETQGPRRRGRQQRQVARRGHAHLLEGLH
jgi:hypothetical protein